VAEGEQEDFRKFFNVGPGGFTASFAQGAWERLSRGKKVLFHDRPGSPEAAIQAAADAGRVHSAEDVRRIIDSHYAARAAALAEAREALAALPDDAAHALDPEPGAEALPLPEVPVTVPAPPELPAPDLLSEMLQGQGEFAGGVPAGTPAPEETSAAHPSAVPPPAAVLSPQELKYLEKFGGGHAAALLKALQEQGAVAGPFAPPPLPTPPAGDTPLAPLATPPALAPPLPPPPVPTPSPATPGPTRGLPAPGSLGPARERGTPPAVAWRELAGLAEGPPVGPTGDVDPGGAAPAQGNIPWDVLAGLSHEVSEKTPWDVVAGLAEGPAAEELAREADRKTEAARTPARVSPFRHPLQYLGQAGQRFVEETLGFDLGLGGDEPPGSEAAEPGPLAGIPRAPAFGAGPGEAASAEPVGAGGAGGASLVPLLERIAAGVERLVEIMGQAQEAGGASFGGRPGRAGPGDDFGYDDDPETPASPSEDLEALFRPGKTQDAFGRPEPEAPKRQRRAAAEEV
jgi:hypothetical protein